MFWSKLYFSTETSSVYFQPNNDLLRHDFHLECLADSIVQCDQIFREVNVEVRTPLLRIFVPPQNLSTSVIFLTNFNTYWRLSTSILMWINKSNVYLLIFSNNRVLNGMICFTTVPIKPIKPYYLRNPVAQNQNTHLNSPCLLSRSGIFFRILTSKKNSHFHFKKVSIKRENLR